MTTRRRPALPEPNPSSARVRTGRPRSRRAHRAVLAAALQLLEARGYRDITIEAIAARAGVGKQTIYRWWQSKADVVLEAYADAAAERVPVPDTGRLEGDLSRFVAATFAGAAQSAPILRGLMAEAQLDRAFAERFRVGFIARRRAAMRGILERARARGELDPDADLELLADLVYGPMWYRLLGRHAPLDDQLAESLVAAVVRAGRPAR